MGRITSYDQDGRMIADYDKSEHDFLRRYGRTPDEVMAENAKLRMFIDLKQTCWKYVGWCDACPYNGVDDEHDGCNCTMQERTSSYARELGIGVPDGEA
jgi:hypothetical protein